MNLTRVGQIQVGHVIQCRFGGKNVEYKVEEVLHGRTNQEEIVIDTKKNKYFITKMAMDGSSWAKDVNFFIESCLFDGLGGGH